MATFLDSGVTLVPHLGHAHAELELEGELVRDALGTNIDGATAEVCRQFRRIGFLWKYSAMK